MVERPISIVPEGSRTLGLRGQQRLGRLHGFHAGGQMHRIDHAW